MAIDQTYVVDAVGVDSISGDLVLTITDHLDWSGGGNEHLLLLQEKINAYLRFVESGEILKTYPDAKSRLVLIDIVHKYPLNHLAKEFYGKVTSIVESAGIKLQHRIFDEAN